MHIETGNESAAGFFFMSSVRQFFYVFKPPLVSYLPFRYNIN